MSTIKTTTLSTQGGSTVPVDTVVNGTAKAWVNFNGTGTVAIRRAFNVSSITDINVGEYQINFAVAMSDSNYASAITASDVTYGAVPYLFGNTGDASTTSCRFFIRSNYTATPPAGDPGTCHVTFFS